MAEPLVGRTQELSAITRAWVQRAPGVVVAGPAGVGKSRIARAAIDELARTGAATLSIQATASAATVPLGALISLTPPLDGRLQQFELMRAASDAVRERAVGGRLALAVDDAHLLDPASAAVILDLVLGKTAFIVATVREGEPVVDAVAALWKDAGATLIEPEPLSREEIRALAEALAGRPVEQAAAAWVYETSLGNALFARELVLGAIATGALRAGRLDARPTINRTLSDVVARRLEHLDAAERDLVDLLAVTEALEVQELVELGGAGTVERIEELGLIRLDTDGRITLAHPLYGETIRAALPAIRRRLLRTRAASVLDARPNPTAHDRLRIAEWRIEAGEMIDPALAVEAAATANLAGRPELAETLARRGTGIRAALALARSLELRNAYADAAAVLAEAEKDIGSREDAIELGDLATEALYWGLNDAESLGALLDRAEDWFDDEQWPKQLIPLKIRVAHALQSAERLSEIDTLLAAADDRSVARQVAPLRAMRLLYAGRAREAAEAMSADRPTVPLRDHADEFAAAVYAGVHLETGQDWAHLATWAEELVRDGIRFNDHAAIARGAMTLGGLAVVQGRFHDAQSHLGEAEAQFERRDSSGLLMVVRALLVVVAGALDGDAVEAYRRCVEAIGPDGPLPAQAPHAIRAAASAAIAAGEASRGQEILLEGAEQLARRPIFAARCAYEALRAGAPADTVAAKIEPLAARTDAPLTALLTRHVRAVAEKNGSALIALADELDQLGARGFACEAAADAARVFAAAGREDSARRAAARSKALFVDGQGGRFPVIEGVDSPRTNLTRREREIATLAARGHSNAEIAERLVLSVRTVESHLFRAMQKLGIGNRRELAALLG